jgi:hypothetical protein
VIAGSGSFHRLLADKTQTAKRAWGCFGRVFTEAHANETDFSNVLFDALRDSLGDLCEETTPQPKPYASASCEAGAAEDGSADETTEIDRDDKTKRQQRQRRLVLVDTCTDTAIGFAAEVYRKKHLGYSNVYGASNNSKTDHACIIFRGNGKGRMNPSQPDDKDERHDVTAVVALKLFSKSCREYTGTEMIDLKAKHGPIG